MTAHITGGVTVDLNDGPIRTEYSRSHFDGKPTARLVIGTGGDSVGIAVTSSPMEMLDQLLEAVSELRAWTATQQLVKHLPEVA